MTAPAHFLTDRDPGAIWGGWWLWEPPAGVTKEEAPKAVTARAQLTITRHAIQRWKIRIEHVSNEAAVTQMIEALASAKDKHFKDWKLARNTFYIPTERAVFVGSRRRIVTVLERDPQDLRD